MKRLRESGYCAFRNSKTLRKMDLTNLQVYYIGDAFSDYQTSLNAKVKFIYFCPNLAERDLRIPESIPVISSHEEIWRRL